MFAVAEALTQNETWINGQTLTEMDPDHRANVIPFLRGNVRTIWIADRLLAGYDHDDIPVTPSQSELEEWLAATPLMVALVELEAGRPIDARKATHERNQAYEQETGYEKVRHG